jgi:hypothetical protein
LSPRLARERLRLERLANERLRQLRLELRVDVIPRRGSRRLCCCRLRRLLFFPPHPTRRAVKSVHAAMRERQRRLAAASRRPRRRLGLEREGALTAVGGCLDLQNRAERLEGMSLAKWLMTLELTDREQATLVHVGDELRYAPRVVSPAAAASGVVATASESRVVTMIVRIPPSYGVTRHAFFGPRAFALTMTPSG